MQSFVPKAGQNLLEDSGGCAQGAQAWGKSVGLQKTTQLLSSSPTIPIIHQRPDLTYQGPGKPSGSRTHATGERETRKNDCTEISL